MKKSNKKQVAKGARLFDSNEGNICKKEHRCASKIPPVGARNSVGPNFYLSIWSVRSIHQCKIRHFSRNPVFTFFQLLVATSMECPRHHHRSCMHAKCCHKMCSTAADCSAWWRSETVSHLSLIHI